MIESILANHCAPAMAGIKPSNLVSIFKRENPNLLKEIDELNKKLNRKDIYIDILCECPKRYLLIVYRKKKLVSHLNRCDIKAFLKTYGYDIEGNYKDMLKMLAKRIRCDEKFPHEIGAFLGYPLEDINAFIEYKGRDCLYTGEWKVYTNLESAKKTFLRYKCCKRAITQRIERGQSLDEIFYAA